MSAPYYIPNPTLRCEQVLINYISGSLVGAGLIDTDTTFYTGMGDSDKIGPAVVVACDQAQEMYLHTRTYRFFVDITTKQIAADSTTGDTSTSSIINFAGNIHSLFGDDTVSTNAINASIALGSVNDFHVYQTKMLDFHNERYQDAWIANLHLEVVAALA